MRKNVAVVFVGLSLVLTACSGDSSTPADSVSQPSEQPAGFDGDTSTSDEATAMCKSGAPREGDTLKVVTSVSPLTSLAGTLAAGTGIEVTGLVPEGTNSHTFEPPPSVAKELAEADLVVVNGLGLEDPIMEMAAANMKDGAVLCEVGTAVILRSEWIFDFSFPQEAGRPNPHAWTNPPSVLSYLTVIRDAMTQMLPSTIQVVDENYVKVSQLINDLDAAMIKATDTVPVRNRKLLTYHDSFPYTARRYGYEIIGAIQPQSFSDPTPADVASLIEQVKDEQVPAVFGSEVFPSPVLEQIGKEAGVRYVDTLRDDDLPGEVDDPEHSWGGLMRYDFVTIVEALGGDASALKAVEVDLGLKDEAYYPQ